MPRSGAEIQTPKRRQRKYAGMPLAIIRNATVDGPGWVIQVFTTNHAATVMNNRGVRGIPTCDKAVGDPGTCGVE